MKEDILAIYKKFEMNNLNMFFDDLIEYMNKYYSVFSKYTSIDYLDAITRVDSTSLIIGHSDDNFEIAIPFYTNKVIEGLSEEELSNQVSSLIWDLSAYMTEELCPSCNDSNLRLTTMVSKEDILVKFCDECLYTGIRNEHVVIEEELVSASKKMVEVYLSGK